jgi:hypothetical protein
MKKKEHRPGVSEVNLVKRHLKLEKAPLAKIQSAVEEIDKLFGMDSIFFDEKSRVLNMAYDATLLCIDGLEEVLKKHDVELDHGWWTHFKEGQYRTVDQNVKDNAKRDPWSCHKK